ncbi:arginase family protein [Umezawaea endophytica]|uniref:Arginase family protein n=1 Tax=Umezawaea endophytica TaxID=1654476 RepID=A0A9X2VHH5_9PSEU|nr:arginase family protein [Umezawaea endophytica]MCS7476810.1 arginase family protein [Umezawaea endophytica]
MADSGFDPTILLDAVGGEPPWSTASPGWAGVPTLFGADLRRDWGQLASDSVEWIAAGVPFDGTTSSRPGAAEGPRAVRAASVVYSSSLSTRNPEPMTDMRTGRDFDYDTPVVVDAGDLTVYPSDPLRTMASVGSGVRTLLEGGGRGLFLVGDHSCTIGTFTGFYLAARERVDPGRIGFVNIDHHFDFGDSSHLHGPIYHGSNSRRISELPGIRPENLAFVGVGDVTRRHQLAGLRERGFPIVAAPRLDGDVRPVTELVEALRERCDTVYISTDIDVLDCSVAPGTGNVTLGGLTGSALLDVWHTLHTLPVGAFDIAEVAPRYDPTGRTAQIAAKLAFDAVFRTEKESTG